MTRWLTIAAAAEYMGCSPTTVKRHLAAGCLIWHVTPTGLRRIDREDIDRLFIKRDKPEKRGVVTDEEIRRYVRQ